MKGIVLATLYVSLLVSLSPQLVLAKKQSDEKDASEKPKNEIKIHIAGANKELKENINAMLPNRKPSCNAKQDEVDNFKKSAESSLAKAAQGLGYYSGTFDTAVSKANNCWIFTITIDKSAVVRVKTLDVKVTGEGKKEKAFQDILKKPMYQIGEQLKQDKYTSYKASLVKVANSLGYFDAKFTQHEISVNPSSNSANIVLHMDTAKRYRYGKITVDQDILDADVMQRYVQIKKGEPYNNSEIAKQQLYLQSTGYYADVIIQSRKGEASNQTIPVDIELSRRKRTAYKLKLGFGTDTGFRTSAKMERRWTGGRGNKLQHELKLSEKVSLFESRYTVPLEHPQTENIFYNIKFHKEDVDDIQSRGAEIGAQYTKKNSGGYQQTFFTKYLKDFTQVDGDDEFGGNYLLVGARAEKTKRNDPLYPNKGYRLSLELQAAREELFSSQSVLRTEFNAKYLQPLGSNTLIARLKVGAAASQNFDLLPSSLRFFAGGRDSVRGYDFRSLGETNSAGSNVGGKHLLTSSVEFDYPIAEKWSAAVFVDTGNAFKDWKDVSLKSGLGFGARWKSPVGPVSVDLAWPTDDFADPHLHLSIGPEL